MTSERDNKMVPAQWLHLLNSSHIQRKLEQGPKLKRLLESGRKPPAMIEELYLTILSRFPTRSETRILDAYGTQPPAWQRLPLSARAQVMPSEERPVTKKREHWLDIAWSLMNSTEFVYRH
jgi:hypothetical protein